MKRTGKCPKCASTDIVTDAAAIDHGHGNYPMEMSVATYRNPKALIFKGQQQTTVSAWVCATCGYVELYADAPGTLKLAGGGTREETSG